MPTVGRELDLCAAIVQQLSIFRDMIGARPYLKFVTVERAPENHLTCRRLASCRSVPGRAGSSHKDSQVYPDLGQYIYLDKRYECAEVHTEKPTCWNLSLEKS